MLLLCLVFLTSVNAAPAPAPSVIKNESKRWKGTTIPYMISPTFEEKDLAMIYGAMAELENKTCVEFKPKSEDDLDYIYFKNDQRSCFSKIGRQGGKQNINLSTPGCTKSIGTVLHEILHAFGFVHEQKRPDRDEHVIVHFENIKPKKKHNFVKLANNSVETFDLEYDYQSVMHYLIDSFSKDKKKDLLTVVPVDSVGYVENIGQRKGLSEQDILQINILFKCNGTNENII